MIRRSIAAVVLASICWLSAPAAFAALQPRLMDAIQAATPPAQDHSCCPGFHLLNAPVVLIAIHSPVMPCGEQHPCCARRAPSPASNTPAESKLIRPVAERMVISSTEKPANARSQTVDTSADFFLPPPFERSTILRN